MSESKRKPKYWLLKTEPQQWSWTDQTSDNNNRTTWDGVKNRQAQNNLKSMHLNDLCFFYHTGRNPKVVGVVKVVREWYGDGVVDVEAVGEMRCPVELALMKKDDGLTGFKMFRQSRLSVVDVEERFWVRVCVLGNGFVGDGKD